MKSFFVKHGLSLALVLLVAFVFVGGNLYSRFMTDQIAVHEEENQGSLINELLLGLFDGATDAEEFTTTPVDVTYFKPLSSTDSYTPVLTGSYKIYEGTTQVGVVYIITTYGKNANLQVAYGITLADHSLSGVTVISNEETPSYYANLNDAFFNQFDGKTLDDIGFSLDAVAGSTMSSKGIETGMFYAREQYAHDYSFVIPSIVMTLNSLTYNTEVSTFIDKPYIADVTYGDDDTNVVVYLSSSFDYAGIITGTEPAADVQSAIKSFASKSTDVSSSSYFVSWDDTTRTLVIYAKGYSKKGVLGSFVFNEELTSVTSFSVETFESYPYSESYNTALGEPPYVENNLINQYLDDEPQIDGVAGASVTSAAMKEMLTLLDLFIEGQNGGL